MTVRLASWGKRTWKKVRPLLDLGPHLGVVLNDGSIALIDHCDRHIAEGWNWTATRGPYAFRGTGKTTIYLAGAILGQKQNHRTDHRNGNTLDNRRENLRHATPSQNAQNRGRQSNNKSGFKGVSWRADRGTWLAVIGIDRKLIKLGTFHRADSAARAYDTAALKHFGEFAVFNFPDEAIK